MPILDLNWMRRSGKYVVVGWPLKPSMYARVKQDAAKYKAAGFDKVLFPPSLLGAAGIYSGGYDKKDDYQLEGTAFGSKAELIAAVAALHEVGISVGCDLTLRQYNGYANQEYTTPLFPKTPSCFAAIPGQPSFPGNVEPDNTPDSPTIQAPLGSLAAYGKPGSYMWDGVKKAVVWLKETAGFDWFRVDEGKDLHAPLLLDILSEPALRDAWAVVEYWDGYPPNLLRYLSYWTGWRVSVFDFGFKFNVSTICNNNSRSWMGSLANCVSLQAPMNSVTFLENHDTDNTPGEQLIWNKPLGLGIQATWVGESSTYYRDWSDDANCYGLGGVVENGLWINKHLAQGDFVVRNAGFQTWAHERTGYGNAPGCVFLANNDQYSAHTLSVQTRYSSGTRLHEYTGNAGYAADAWVGSGGVLTVTIPRNDNGLGYLVHGLYV